MNRRLSIIAETLFDTIVMEDRGSDVSFPNPPRTNESDRFEVFGKASDPLDQPVASETSPRPRRM